MNDYLLNHFVFPRKINPQTSPRHLHFSARFISLFARGLKELDDVFPNLVPSQNRSQLIVIFDRWLKYQNSSKVGTSDSWVPTIKGRYERHVPKTQVKQMRTMFSKI